mmetsp:Transcript_35787/g.84123  ORF Transcript_35787/g.84123 Transcript_35787/m.84123 type:complete len:112 (+) Transcript_35787:85-420(+)
MPRESRARVCSEPAVVCLFWSVQVIGVAKTWIDHPMIAEMACWALANMAAAGGKPADYIVKKEGPQAVMAVMKKWEKAPNIQYAGTVALAHLGSESALTKLLDYPAFVFFQ